ACSPSPTAEATSTAYPEPRRTWPRRSSPRGSRCPDPARPTTALTRHVRTTACHRTGPPRTTCLPHRAGNLVRASSTDAQEECMRMTRFRAALLAPVVAGLVAGPALAAPAQAAEAAAPQPAATHTASAQQGGVSASG